ARRAQDHRAGRAQGGRQGEDGGRASREAQERNGGDLMCAAPQGPCTAAIRQSSNFHDLASTAMNTLLVAEHDNKTLKDATAKALSAAKALGADVHVLVAGKDCRAVAEAAAKLDGVNKVLLADAAGYEHMLAESTSALIHSLARNYDAIIAPATTTGKNIMPRVAA